MFWKSSPAFHASFLQPHGRLFRIQECPLSSTHKSLIATLLLQTSACRVKKVSFLRKSLNAILADQPLSGSHPQNEIVS